METLIKSTSQIIEVKHLLNNYKADIEKQLDALVRMAKRLKLTPPTWKFGEVYEHEFSILVGQTFGEDADSEYETYIEPCFDITLSVSETLKIDGEWIFACAIDHRNKVMIQIDEDAKIPVRYSPSNDCCEHCGKKYPRVKSYVVLNQSTGEFKQVGKGCLKQFLGINPASYITMFEAISKFSPIIEGFGRKNHGGRLEDLAYDVNDMLRYAIHQVAKDGKFVKSEWKKIETGERTWSGEEKTKNVRANEGESTLDKVKVRIGAIGYFRMNPNALNDNTTVEQLNERIKFHTMRLGLYAGLELKYESTAWWRHGELQFLIYSIKQHIHAVTYKNLIEEKILPYNEEMDAVKAFMSNMVIEVKQREKYEGTTIDEFMNNIEGKTVLVDYKDSFNQWKELIKNIFAKSRTLQSNLKSICSGYGFYLTQVERMKSEAIRLAGAANLIHIGVVGEKIELTLKVIDLKEGEGQYGVWKLWKLEDANGYKFSKFGEIAIKFTTIEAQPENVYNSEGIASGDVNIGSTIQIVVDVKKHDIFREEKVTVLGRVSKVKKANYLYK